MVAVLVATTNLWQQTAAVYLYIVYVLHFLSSRDESVCIFELWLSSGVTCIKSEVPTKLQYRETWRAKRTRRPGRAGSRVVGRRKNKETSTTSAALKRTAAGKAAAERLGEGIPAPYDMRDENPPTRRVMGTSLYIGAPQRCNSRWLILLLSLLRKATSRDRRNNSTSIMMRIDGTAVCVCCDRFRDNGIIITRRVYFAVDTRFCRNWSDLSGGARNWLPLIV